MHKRGEFVNGCLRLCPVPKCVCYEKFHPVHEIGKCLPGQGMGLFITAEVEVERTHMWRMSVTHTHNFVAKLKNVLLQERSNLRNKGKSLWAPANENESIFERIFFFSSWCVSPLGLLRGNYGYLTIWWLSGRNEYLVCCIKSVPVRRALWAVRDQTYQWRCGDGERWM